MIMTGDKITIRVFHDPQHDREIITPNHGTTLEVYEQTGVPGYAPDEPVPGVDWIHEDGRTAFTPLDDFGGSLFEIARVNPLPIDLEFDDFVKLYAPDPGEKINASERLRRSLIRATHAALAAIGDGEDGGTCNFDAPALDFSALGLRKPQAERVIDHCGLRCYDWRPFKSHRDESGKLIKAPTYLVITGFQRGQANLRTRMAEAFCHSLNRDGIESGMYYQMD